MIFGEKKTFDLGEKITCAGFDSSGEHYLSYGKNVVSSVTGDRFQVPSEVVGFRFVSDHATERLFVKSGRGLFVFNRIICSTSYESIDFGFTPDDSCVNPIGSRVFGVAEKRLCDPECLERIFLVREIDILRPGKSRSTAFSEKKRDECVPCDSRESRSISVVYAEVDSELAGLGYCSSNGPVICTRSGNITRFGSRLQPFTCRVPHSGSDDAVSSCFSVSPELQCTMFRNRKEEIGSEGNSEYYFTINSLSKNPASGSVYIQSVGSGPFHFVSPVGGIGFVAVGKTIEFVSSITRKASVVIDGGSPSIESVSSVEMHGSESFSGVSFTADCSKATIWSGSKFSICEVRA